MRRYWFDLTGTNENGETKTFVDCCISDDCDAARETLRYDLTKLGYRKIKTKLREYEPVKS